MENRITTAFKERNDKKLTIYFTAGFPKLDDTMPVLEALQEGGADIIEIGMPYSDPIADGPTIQMSNETSLANGMSIHILFEQLTDMRKKISIPVLLMGYLNPVLQYGIEKFCQRCKEVGIDGLIVPDLPLREYMLESKPVFEKYGLVNTFLISPQTAPNRISEIDKNSTGFIYMVSSASVTGAKTGISKEQEAYFNSVKQMSLEKPVMIGFGISDKESFDHACRFADGAIIGSAFINVLAKSNNLKQDVIQFVKAIKGW